MEYIAGHPIYYHWWPLLTVLLGTGCRIGEDLSKTAIDEFRKKAVKSGRMPEVEVDIDDETLLRNLKLFDGKYLTRAATLLFHPEPELFATGAYIKIGYFAKE